MATIEEIKRKMQIYKSSGIAGIYEDNKKNQAQVQAQAQKANEAKNRVQDMKANLATFAQEQKTKPLYGRDLPQNTFNPSMAIAPAGQTLDSIGYGKNIGLPKPAENVAKAVTSFGLGAADTMTLGLQPLIDKNKNPDIYAKQQAIQKEYPKSAIAGNIAGYLLPGVTSTKLVAPMTKGVSNTIGRTALQEGIAGTGIEAIGGLTRGLKEDMTGMDLLKNVGKSAVIGGLTGAGLGAGGVLIGKGIKAGNNYLNRVVDSEFDNISSVLRPSIESTPAMSNVPAITRMMDTLEAKPRTQYLLPAKQEPLLLANKPEPLLLNAGAIPQPPAKPVMLGEAPKGKFNIKPKEMPNNDFEIQQNPVDESLDPLEQIFGPSAYDAEKLKLDMLKNVGVKGISDRTFQSVGDRKVKSIQQNFPKLKPYIQEQAKFFLNDLRDALKGKKIFMLDEEGYLEKVTGQKRAISEPLARILDNLDHRPTYKEIDEALQKIIEDGGAENNALSKRIELVIDDSLTDGYKDMSGLFFPPDEGYVALKTFQPGKISDFTPAKRTSEQRRTYAQQMKQAQEPNVLSANKNIETPYRATPAEVYPALRPPSVPKEYAKDIVRPPMVKNKANKAKVVSKANISQDKPPQMQGNDIPLPKENRPVKTQSKASKFDNIKKTEDLPDTLDELQEFVDEMAKRKLDLVPINLRLFSDAQKKLNQIKMKQRKFIANSVLSSNATPDEMKNFFRANMPEYEPITNIETWQSAVNKVNDNLQSARNEWNGLDATTTADDTALGQALMFDAIKKGNVSEANDIAYQLAEKLTKAGQAVQAASILKRLTPEGMLTYVNRTLQQAERNATGKLTGKLKLSDDEARRIKNAMDKISEMEDGRKKDIEFGKIKKLVSDKIPATFRDKLKSLQRINLLFNPKTMIRNVGGNIIGSGFLANAKDVLRAGLDKAVSTVTKNDRTAFLPSFKTQAKGFVQGAKNVAEDYRLGIDTSNVSTQFELDTQRVTSPFKNKILKTADDLTKLGLRMGDTPFYQAAYDEALRQQMKAVGVTTATEEMKAFARNVAEERTFQDTNKYVDFFNGLRNALNKLGYKDFGLGDVILPFTKTPANILKTGVEYSPLNIINVANKAYKLAKEGGAEAQYNFVDSLAKTLTGTGLLGAGMYLASAGAMSGEESSNNDAASFKREQGILPYALKVGKDYVSFDWAQPASIPLAMGADIYYNMKNAKTPTESIIKGLQGGTGTLFSQSMIQGLQRLFSTYNQSGGLIQNLTNAGYNAVLQLMPFNALTRQVAELVDPVSRSTYDDTSIKSQLVNKAINTIPGARMALPPKIKTTGDVTDSRAWYNVLFNPANVGKTNLTPVKNEILRLFEKSGETIQFPRIADKEITYKTDEGKQKKQLNGKERARYQELLGMETMKNIETLIKTGEYANSKKDADKAKMMQSTITKANNVAKEKLLKELGIKAKD